MRRFVSRLPLIAVLALAVARAPSPAEAVYAPPPGCPAEALTVEQDLARRKPNEARYPVCIDARRVLAEAQAKARQEGRLVLVHFGAPWCPICRVLPGELTALAETTADPMVKAAIGDFIHVSLSMSVIEGGKRHEIQVVHDILAELARDGDVERLNAIPYLVVLAPEGRRHVGRNLYDLQSAVYGKIDREELGRNLARARAHVLTGAPAPEAPSWLARKWRRIFGP